VRIRRVMANFMPRLPFRWGWENAEGGRTG
jgi:hypothetical protein